MAEKGTTEIAPRGRQRVARGEHLWTSSPFTMLERFVDEIDSVFDNFGLGRAWPAPRSRQGWLRTPARGRMEMWAPEKASPYAADDAAGGGT